MGKYTSPEIIKVNPLAGLAQSVGKGLDQVASNVRAENTLKAKQAAANAKSQKDLLKEAKAKRKEVEGFRADLLNLDVPQITGWTEKYRAAVNKEIDERLMPLTHGSDDWYAEVGRIKKYINKSDNMIQYVSDNRKKWETAHEQKNGQWVMKKGIEGARLNLDDPEEIAVWDILDNWYLNEGDRIDFSFGSDGGAVGIVLDNTTNVPILDANNQQVIDPTTGKPKTRALVEGEKGFKENKTLNFGAVLVNEDLGIDMINTASASQAREIRDGAASTLFGKQYKANATKMIETIQSGNKVSRTEYVQFEQANENVRTDIALNLDSYIPENKVQAQNLFQTGEPRSVTYDVWYDKPTYGLTSNPQERITVAEYNKLSAADQAKFGSKEASGYFPQTSVVDTKTETFDRDNPAHRACYEENYSQSIIKENEIYNTAINEIKNLPVKPGYEDIAKFETEGVDMSFGQAMVDVITTPSLGSLGSRAYLDKSIDGKTIKEYFEDGKLTPLVIADMAEEYSQFRDDNTILFAKTIMQNNPANKNYSFFTGVEQKANLVNKYKDAFIAATDAYNNNITIDEKNILKFAAGHWPNPNADPADPNTTWIIPSNPSLWANPNFNMAESIYQKADAIQDNVLYKTGGSSMKAVYDVQQLQSPQFLEEVIYDNVNVSKSERNKLKKGVNSKYKQIATGTTTIGNQGSSINTPPKPTNPPASGKIWVVDPSNNWVEIDKP